VKPDRKEGSTDCVMRERRSDVSFWHVKMAVALHEDRAWEESFVGRRNTDIWNASTLQNIDGIKH
jgi:hypothetical protein